LGLLYDKILQRMINIVEGRPWSKLKLLKSTGDEALLEMFFKNVKSFDEFQFINAHALSNCSSMVVLSCHQPNVDIVEYLYSEKEGKGEAIFHSKGIYNAAKYGYLDVVKYMTEKEKLFPNYDFSFVDDKFFAIDVAAAGGYFDVVKWLHYNRQHIQNCSRFAMEYAAEHGYFDIVEFLHKNRKEGPSKNTLVVAASNGHFNIVKFLHENIPLIYCSKDAINFAAENGHTEVVRYLLKNRMEGSSSYALEFASLNGHFEIIKLLCEQKFKCVQATVNACINNHYDIAEFLIKKNRLLPSPHGFDYTCFKGNYAIVQLLHESGARCTTNAMDMAAQMGHLDIVEYLHINRTEGCTTSAMDLAALGGYLEVVRFLHGNRMEGCTFKAIDNASTRGFLEIVQFLVANNYPYVNALKNAMEYSKKDVFEFLFSRLDLSSHDDQTTYRALVKRSKELPISHPYYKYFDNLQKTTSNTNTT